MVFTLRDWFAMLATTRMTKSFKMVLLRVLLDNDAVFSGMPIPELAAKCREFLVAHEFLRRDIADAATGQPVEMSPRKWESSWRKFPISIWMQEQESREWEFRFVKIACNVAGPGGSNVGDTLPNELPTLLRESFGPDAGLPGTSFEVEFHRDGDAWHIAPLSPKKPQAQARGIRSTSEQPSSHLPGHDLPLLSSPPPTSRFTTHVPVYDLTAAAG
ncbi:MAG: GspH/FimT family protein, partial [Pirellulales bacterium]